MHRAVIFVLIIIVSIACASKELGVPSYNIKRATTPAFSQPNLRTDLCFTCLDSVVKSLNILLDLIVHGGSAVGTCDTLCQALAEKMGSQLPGTFCDLACDAVDIKKFMKLIRSNNLDPIWYCELANTCPIKDDGDAKFTKFSISPTSGPKGTIFSIAYEYVSKNGTGIGELAVDLHTPDHIPLNRTFFLEANKAGTYSDFIYVESKPDPTCDPTEEECEQWLPGIYSLKLRICNGICRSKNPHSAIYDTAKGSFQITQ